MDPRFRGDDGKCAGAPGNDPDGAFDWSATSAVVGPCIRPGGVALTERAVEICNLAPGSRIADIGCGAGGTLEHLQRTGLYRLVGLDCSETLLGLAASRLASGGLVQGRAEALPFREASFDAILCECVLSIVQDRSAAIREFARVLKDDGCLIVSDVFDRSKQSQLQETVTELGFSILLSEENHRVLKEFAARLILAGKPFPRTSGCGLSYFLLVARKPKASREN